MYDKPVTRLLLGVSFALICGTTGCRKPVPSPSLPRPSISTPALRFVEVTEQAGIHFRHINGAVGKKYMPETMGSGVAILDYDNDGWQDILFVNSTRWPGDRGPRGVPALYRNNRDGTFADVTAAAGLDVEMYGMGVAVGDFDNDGYRDIFLTALGPNRLLRNTMGDPGRSHSPIFQDVTAEAGVAGVPVPGPNIGRRWKWSTSAAWLDYNRDGQLDLFVCNYVRWSPQTDIWCGFGETKVYCPPKQYEGVCCTLYRNETGGRDGASRPKRRVSFRDVSTETGIAGPQLVGKSLGVAVADFNGDGWPDIAVSNDTWANFLFLNQQGKRFSERGAEIGIALPESGNPKAGMGIDAADWRNDRRFGLLIGNFAGEGLSLYAYDSPEFASDQSHASGMSQVSLPFLTFGLFWFDADLDGWQDALMANGHIDDLIATQDASLSYEQRPLLFRNIGNGAFTEMAAICGLAQPFVGRGAAYGDLDNDGDLDVVFVSNGQSARVYRNEGGNRNRWIRFRTVGTQSSRDGIGALLRITGGVTQSQYVHSGGSYLSESQQEPTFGLGAQSMVQRVEITWQNGLVEKYGPLRANRRYVVTEGRGVTEETRGPASAPSSGK